jgi:hypothetical protein
MLLSAESLKFGSVLMPSFCTLVRATSFPVPKPEQYSADVRYHLSGKEWIGFNLVFSYKADVCKTSEIHGTCIYTYSTTSQTWRPIAPYTDESERRGVQDAVKAVDC